ncbi:Hypothetical protein D9617_33g038350 [Elsinoe fawcettii]|nr:Hypothetical protein D9617_33g038350 [Elsinoe fawcettii]
MPVQWDAVKDQFLLVQLAQDIKLSSEQIKRIIDQWPESMGDAPTSRAITEHIVKLRSNLGKAGVGGFNATGAKGTGKNAGIPKNPAKPRARAAPTRGNGKGPNKKRKKDDSESEEADMTEEDATIIKDEVEEEDDGAVPGGGEEVTPRKSLPRKTKSPENKEKQSRFIKETLGESSDDDDAGPGDQGEYQPAKEEMMG